MRNLLSIILLVVLVPAFIVSAATAQRQPAVEPVGTIVPTPINLGTFEGQASCQVGNLNAGAWIIYSFLTPTEDYKLLFDPMLTCAACPIGLKVTKIYLYLYTKAKCTVVLSVDVERAILQSPDCYAPGPVLCQTGLYSSALPSAGGWILGIPVNVTDCTACPGFGCLPMGPKYFLSVHFQSMTCTNANIGFVTDAGPAALCTNWNNDGTGWYDLLGAFPDWPGQLKFFADADCCNPPTSVDGSTWGRIKVLYR